MFAEVVSACAGGAVLTGWALTLGCSPTTIALLGALPFLAQLLHVPSAFLTERFGRKAVAIAAVTISRQLFLPLAILPFLSLSAASARTLLVVIAAASAVTGVVANNAWVAWMGDLVPRSIRGRYFGGRSARCTFAGSLAALAAGFALDGTRARGIALVGLSVLAAIAALSGLVTTFLMAQQHEPVSKDEQPRLDLAAALRPFCDRAVRPLLVYQAAWNGAVGIGAGFFSIYMLRDLGLGFVLVAAHGVATAVVRMIASPRWGRAIDRAGEGPILVACSFGVALVPLLWVLPSSAWFLPLILDPILAGILWSGHALAAFAMPLSVAPARERPFYLAALASAGGGAFALGAALGGALVARFPSGIPALGLRAMQLTFVASAFARLFAASLSLRLATLPAMARTGVNRQTAT
ncbi:MAG: MFS transporter [Polyangiales bacterium]